MFLMFVIRSRVSLLPSSHMKAASTHLPTLMPLAGRSTRCVPCQWPGQCQNVGRIPMNQWLLLDFCLKYGILPCETNHFVGIKMNVFGDKSPTPWASFLEELCGPTSGSRVFECPKRMADQSGWIYRIVFWPVAISGWVEFFEFTVYLCLEKKKTKKQPMVVIPQDCSAALWFILRCGSSMVFSMVTGNFLRNIPAVRALNQ